MSKETKKIKKTKRILGKVIFFTEEEIEISKLRFFIDNPRIYTAVRRETDNPTPGQEQIFQILKGKEHVRDLVRRIEHHGGVLEPLLVKDGTFEVLEGNSRLAACKMLIEKYQKKPNTKILQAIANLNCEMIPGGTEDDIIFALLGELHIKGKKAWDAYEKSSYIHRRMQILMRTKSYDDSKKQVAHEAGESSLEIEKRKITIDLMNKYDEQNINKYSYYDVVVRNRAIQKQIVNNTQNEEKIIDCIKNYSAQGTDFRKKIQDVCAHKKAAKMFFERDYTLDAAYELIDVDINTLISKISKFRSWLHGIESDVEKLNKFQNDFDKLHFEFRQLSRDSKRKFEIAEKIKNK